MPIAQNVDSKSALYQAVTVYITQLSQGLQSIWRRSFSPSDTRDLNVALKFRDGENLDFTDYQLLNSGRLGEITANPAYQSELPWNYRNAHERYKNIVDNSAAQNASDARTRSYIHRGFGRT